MVGGCQSVVLLHNDISMNRLASLLTLLMALFVVEVASAQCNCGAVTTAYYAPTATYYAPATTAYYAPATAYYAPTTAY